MEQIGTRSWIDEGDRRRVIESIAVLRRELGEGWSPAASHPLLWRIRTICGNPFARIVSMLADDITALKAIADIRGIVSRIKRADQYDGAAAELEVGGMLARSGCRLTVEPELGKKKPDFFCEKKGFGFLAEVKTLRTAEETKKADRTSQRIIAACSPIFPVGIILRPLSEPHLKEIERMLKEKAGCVTRETPKEVDVRSVLKLYLVHPDDPDQVRRYGEWCREQQRLEM